MSMFITAGLILLAAIFQADDGRSSDLKAGALCSDSWHQFIDKKVATSDGQGHGPDIGSDEWKSVIEFKLGIRGNPNLPGRDSEAWCRHIDQIVRAKDTTLKKDGSIRGSVNSTEVSYDCDGDPKN